MIRSIVESLGSKRLTAMLAGLLSLLALQAAAMLRAKLGLSISDDMANRAALYVAGLVVAYIASQWHLDTATDGKTTTAYLVAAKLARALADDLDPQAAPANPPSASPKA